MKSWDSINLRMNLAFLTIAILSAGFVGTILYSRSRDALEKQVLRDLTNTSQILGTNLDSRIKQAAQLVDQLAARSEFSSFSIVEAQTTMKNFVQFADLFYNLFLYSADGSVLAAAYLDQRDTKGYLVENFHNINTPFRGYALQVLGDGKPRFTNAFRVTEDHLLVAYVAPVVREQTTVGLISCGIHLNDPKLEKLVSSFSPARGGFVLLLEPTGRILARGGEINEELGSLAPAVWGGSNASLHVAGKGYLFKAEPLNHGGLSLLVAIPDDVLKSTIEELGQSLTVYTLLALLLSLLISTWIGKSFIRPISALVKGLKAVGEGVYTQGIDEISGGEMGEAIDAYNEMIDKLQKKRIIEKIWMDHWDV